MLKYSRLDRLIINFDHFLRKKQAMQNLRPNPSADLAELPLTTTEKQQSIAMLRVNHSGEICAQALYQGQALTARTQELANSLRQAASEENDHLNWCQQRLNELHGKTSIFNPLWYAGSFAIGTVAGLGGDQMSLGFLAETEYQVTKHLEGHLAHMANSDVKSRAILQQMRNDELQHATTAERAGGMALPTIIKTLMRCAAKVLTFTAAKY